MFVLTLDSPTLISVAALGVAAFSAIIAANSFRIAQKSYALNAKASALSQPNVALYLIDSFRYRLKEQAKTAYVFCVSVENKSTISNTIVDVEMRLPFVKNTVERLAVFSLINQAARSNTLNITNTLQLPIGIAARGALITNCYFEIPNEMLANAEFSTHIVRFKYADGEFNELTPKLIMDVVDAEDLEKKRNTGVPI